MKGNECAITLKASWYMAIYGQFVVLRERAIVKISVPVQNSIFLCAVVGYFRVIKKIPPDNGDRNKRTKPHYFETFLWSNGWLKLINVLNFSIPKKFYFSTLRSSIHVDSVFYDSSMTWAHFANKAKSTYKLNKSTLKEKKHAMKLAWSSTNGNFLSFVKTEDDITEMIAGR